MSCCAKCGWCCKHININIAYSDFLRWAKEKRYDILSKISYVDNSDPQKRGFYFLDTLTAPKKPCPFLKNNQCSIHDTKPRACKDFPYAHDEEKLKEWRAHCTGTYEQLEKVETFKLKREQSLDFVIAEDRKEKLINLLKLVEQRNSAERQITAFGADPTENLYVSALGTERTDYTGVGSTPYLDAQDQPTNYIYSTTKKGEIGDFDFANTSHSSDTLNSVTLYVYGQYTTGGNSEDIFIHDGSTWNDVGWGDLPTSWGWVSIDVSSILNTWAKVDAAKMYILRVNTNNQTDYDAAYLLVDYTSSATYTKAFTADAILITRGSKELTADAILKGTLTKTFTADAILAGVILDSGWEESGGSDITDNSKWDNGSYTSSGETLSVQSSDPAHGSYYLRCTTNGDGSYEYARVERSLSSPTKLNVRGIARIPTNGIDSNLDYIKFIEVYAGASQVASCGIRRNSSGVDNWWLETRDGASWIDRETTAVGSFDLTEWFNWELEWTYDASNGGGRLEINGNQIYSTTGDDTTAQGYPNEARVGAITYNVAATVVELDDMKITTYQYIGPLALQKTITLTVDALIAERHTKTLTADAILASGATTYTKTFTSDAVLYPDVLLWTVWSRANFSKWTGTYNDGPDTIVANNTEYPLYGTYNVKATLNNGANTEWAQCHSYADAAYNPRYLYAGRLRFDTTPDTNEGQYFMGAGHDSHGTALVYAGIRNDGGTNKWVLWYRNSGSFSYAYGSSTPTVNTNYEVQLGVYRNLSSNGWVRLWVDGNLEIEVTGIDHVDRNLYYMWLGFNYSAAPDASDAHMWSDYNIIDTEPIMHTTGTKTLTANALLQKTSTKSLISDALLQKTSIITLTADANIAARYTKSLTSDALLLKTSSTSITSDALLLKTQTKSLTSNALLQKVQTKSFTADAILTAGGTATKSFTANALLLKTSEVSIAADARLVTQTTKSVTADALLQQVFTKTLTADAILPRNSFRNGVEEGNWSAWSSTTGSPTVQSSIKYEGTYAAAIDAATEFATVDLYATRSKAFFGVRYYCSSLPGTDEWTDILTGSSPLAWVARAGIWNDGGVLKAYLNIEGTQAWNTFSWEAGKFYWFEVQYDSDTDTYKLYINGSEVVDTSTTSSSALQYLRMGSYQAGWWAHTDYYDKFIYQQSYIGPQEVSLSVDALLLKTSSISLQADAILLKVNQVSLTSDALLLKTSSKSLSANALLQKTSTKTLTADAQLVLTGTSTKTLTVDALLLKTSTKTLTGDALLQKKSTKTLTADARLQLIGTKTLSANALVQKIQTLSFTADAILFSAGTYTKQFTVNALLLKTQTLSLTADAQLASRHTLTLSVDALLSKPSEVSLSANALLLKTSSKTFTSDALLKKTQTLSLTANALLQKTFTTSFTADAILIGGGFKTLTANALLLKTQSTSFTTDALLLKPSTLQLTADAVLAARKTKTLTSNALLLKHSTKSLSADGLLLKSSVKTLTGDALLQRIGEISFTTDAILLQRSIISFTANARLTATPIKTLSADALLQKTFSLSFTVNAIIVAGELIQTASIQLANKSTTVILAVKIGNIELANKTAVLERDGDI